MVNFMFDDNKEQWTLDWILHLMPVTHGTTKMSHVTSWMKIE